MSDQNSSLSRYLSMLPNNPGGGGMLPQAAIIWDALLTKQVAGNIEGDMAEIGVFRGFGACLMGAHLRSTEQLILVDRMCGLDYSRDAIAEVAGAEVLNRVTFHQVDSMSLGRGQSLAGAGREFRFFHIDGEHSYDGVMNDLRLAEDNTAAAALVVVDDFFSAASPAITHAVFDYIGMPDSRFSLFLIGYNKAYLCSNRWLGFYREATIALPRALEFHGYPSQLAAGGFAFERSYAGISAKASEHSYQLIGAFIPNAEDYLSATNSYR